MMRVKQITGMPATNDFNRGAHSFKLVDRYPTDNPVNRMHIEQQAYTNLNYSPGLSVVKHQENKKTAEDTVPGTIMRLSFINTALMMVKRALLRIWAFTQDSVIFIWAIFKFMYTALEFMVLFVKFLFTQKHWSN